MVVKKSDLPLTYVKWRGLFNYSELLQAIKSWFKSYDYHFEEPTHKWKTGDGYEAEIKFKGNRKVNEYVKYYLEVFLRTWDMKEVEVVKDGQKFKMYDGKVAIEISGKVEFDWQKRFGGNKFLQHLQDFFHKFIIRQDINEKWEDELLFKMMNLTKVIKEKLGHEAI